MAFIDHHNAPRELLQLIHIVTRDHNRNALFPIETLDKLQHIAFGKHINPDSRLVQKENLRLVHKHKREIRPHLLSQTELTRETIKKRINTQKLFHKIEHSVIPVPGNIPHHALPLKTRRNGLVPPQLCPLTKNHANALHIMDAILHGIHAQTANSPRSRCKHTGKQLHSRRFSRTIGTRIRHDLAAANLEIHLLQRANLPDIGTKQILENIPNLLRTLALVKNLIDLGKLNRDVRNRGSAVTRSVHSAAFPF